MTWLTFILYFTAVSLVYGIPSPLHGKIARIPLQQSNYRLRSSSNLLKEHSQNMKHPTFMMQLYQTLIVGNITDLSSLEHPVLHGADTVFSLYAKSCSEVDNTWSLFFDMSSISRNNDVQLAELRIHLPSLGRQQKKVDIYHSKEGQEKVFLGSFSIDSSPILESSWKVFNFTEMLNTYLHRDSKKPGMSKIYEMGTCGDVSSERAVLVVFTKDKPLGNLHRYPNLIQTVETSKYVTRNNGGKRLRKIRNLKHRITSDFPTRHIADARPLCKRVDMIVDFEKIGWGEEIIYPKKFNAYRCEGACPVPLNEIFNPTNHAYVKSLVKMYHSERVGCSSCVPVKLRPMSMLMYEEGKVVMKHHEDLIVEKCGCH